MTRRLARAKFHDITSGQEVGLHALVCGRRGCRQKLAIQQNWQFNKSGTLAIQQKLAIQQNNTNWQFNEGGNSTKWEIQQKVEVQQNWKFKIVSVCPSSNLPPPILQIWNGRFCTLIHNTLWLLFVVKNAIFKFCTHAHTKSRSQAKYHAHWSGNDLMQ